MKKSSSTKTWVCDNELCAREAEGEDIPEGWTYILYRDPSSSRATLQFHTCENWCTCRCLAKLPKGVTNLTIEFNTSKNVAVAVAQFTGG